MVDKKKKDQLWDGSKGVCAYCGCNMVRDGEKNPNSFTVDHVFPKSKGGTDAISNLVGCCFKCNSEKADSTVNNLREAQPTSIRYRQQKRFGKLLLVLQINKTGVWRDATIEDITERLN